MHSHIVTRKNTGWDPGPTAGVLVRILHSLLDLEVKNCDEGCDNPTGCGMFMSLTCMHGAQVLWYYGRRSGVQVSRHY